MTGIARAVVVPESVNWTPIALGEYLTLPADKVSPFAAGNYGALVEAWLDWADLGQPARGWQLLGSTYYPDGTIVKL